MKSKLMRNSKDLLSRSFNPTKCKTSLRLAGSRLKLLRNKKEVQVKQMKREIAQLLESGQDQTARIRVEHVIREEKMMAAYDLLEIYCELIVARLPIIESQKQCPIDLKEAIASVAFASPRCGDVPELLDVRKHFSAKYGKEFTTAAIELRPQCGVGRLLVEKLSAAAPDGQTKIKILSAIAEEHNVKWDPESREEKDLSGPSFIRKESELQAEPPRFEAADVQALPINNMHGSPLNFAHQDARISSGQTSGVSTKIQPEARPPGDKVSQLFQGDSNNSHLDGQRWDMEFKDAASAAQAAAESAERASIAARAAAELSSHGRILTPYSTESHKSDVYSSKYGLEAPPNLNSFEKNSEASVNISSSERTGLQNTQVDKSKPSNLMTSSRFEEGGGGSVEYSQSASLKSKASGDDNSILYQYTQKNTLKEVSEGETNFKKQSFSYETETANKKPEKAENHGEGNIVKQKSLGSSCSQSSIPEDVNIFATFDDQKFENDAAEVPFMSISDTGFHVEAPQTSSHESATVFFDKSDSDGDDYGPDKGPEYDEPEIGFHFPSLRQKSPEPQSINADSWSPRSSSSNMVTSASPPLFFTTEKSSPDFSKNTILRDNAEPNISAPVRFDDSDGPASDSDEDMNASKVLRYEHNERGKSVGSPFKYEEHSDIDNIQLSFSSDDEGIHWKRNQDNNSDAGSSEKFGHVKPEDSQIDLKDIGTKFSPEIGETLNFGKLTGGLRHKKHNQLPLLKNRSNSSLSVKKEAETSTSTTIYSSLEDPTITVMLEHKKSANTPDQHSESDSDSSEEEEFLQKKSSHKESLSAVKPVKTKSTFGASKSIFDSNDSDLDEDTPMESLTRKSHLRSGISRRTKASPSSSRANTQSGALDSDGKDRKSTTSYVFEAPKNSGAHMRNSGKWESSDQSISAGVASVPAKSNFSGSTEQTGSAKATPLMKQESEKRLSSRLGNSTRPNVEQVVSKPKSSTSWGTPEKPNLGKATYKTMQESKVSQNPSAVEEPPRLQQKSDATTRSEIVKTATSDKTSSNKDDSTKKASHVHPKLPDYDALVQSLRKNRS